MWAAPCINVLQETNQQDMQKAKHYNEKTLKRVHLTLEDLCNRKGWVYHVKPEKVKKNIE